MSRSSPGSSALRRCRKISPFSSPSTALGRLSDAGQFEDIIVKTATGPAPQIVRLRDIARVDLSQQNFSNFSRFTGHKSAQIVVFALPDANAIAVADSVYKAMAEMSKKFPEGLKYAIRYDTTRFVREAISSVYETLIIAGILVLIVILLFLQSFRAMLVPATTVPVTIIGAFIAMAALGFTINLMTLFALILAIGIVVDDAIVIVENSSYYIEKGMPPKEATIKAMQELTGPIMGITAGPGFGLPAGGLPARHHRPDLSSICPGHRLHRRHQRHQCPDLEAGPVRLLAEAPRGKTAELVLPGIQQGLSGRDRCLHGDRRPDGEAAGADVVIVFAIIITVSFLVFLQPAHRLSPHRGPGLCHSAVPPAGRRIAAPVTGGGGQDQCHSQKNPRS